MLTAYVREPCNCPQPQAVGGVTDTVESAIKLVAVLALAGVGVYFLVKALPPEKPAPRRRYERVPGILGAHRGYAD